MSSKIGRNIFGKLVGLLTVVYVYGESRKYVFTANMNFDSPARWGDHGLPCAGDRILFPLDDVISVYVQTGTTISEMMLPMNGEFIFGDGAVWGVSNDLSPCFHAGESHDTQFNSAPDSWFHPGNWKTNALNDDIALGPQDLLDIEKVPCDSDDAEFVGSSSFTAEINLDSMTRNLRVAEMSFDTEGFASYRTLGGKYKFIGSGEMTINQQGCQDPSGCLCRNHYNLETVFNAICGYTECVEALCENPILGYGSCCKRCGSMLTFNYTDQYTETAMADFLSSISSKSQYANSTHTVLSKVDSRMLIGRDDMNDELSTYVDGRSATGVVIQIYVTDDSGTGSDAKQLASQYYNVLNSPSNDLGVSNVIMLSSGEATSQGLHAGAIAGIVIGSVFGIILLALLLYNFRNIPLRGKRYQMEFELDDSRPSNYNFANVTEVGPGEEFESSDYDTQRKAAPIKSRETMPWPQRSAMESDFGVSFGNPAFEDHEM